MKLIQHWLSSGRVKGAARRLANDPSARHYAELAQLHAMGGALRNALEVASEGLSAHPNDPELKRLHDRTRQLQREGRTHELLLEIKSHPRAGLWRELVGIMLEDGRVARAEEAATDWYQYSKSGEALYWRARARSERFFADRRRDDGRLALELSQSARDALPGDDRPLRLLLELYSRLGAWADARRVLARLLELNPGEQHLEARFRSVAALAEKSPDLEHCLREIERTGRFADETLESTASAPQNAGLTVRPLLQQLAREKGVQAAFYVRGSTALVQGPRGYTAERTARGVTEILTASRAAGRKLGLGQAVELRIEGQFGTLLIAPGELGAGALWVDGRALSRKLEEGLRDLAGMAGLNREVEA